MEKMISTEKNKEIIIREVMVPINRIPVVGGSVIFKEAIQEMIKWGLGIVCIIDNEGKLSAIITDGDIRRMLLKVQKPLSALLIDDAIDHASRAPIAIAPTDTVLNAAVIMEEKQIWDLPVVDERNILVGLVHLHPVVKALLGM